MTNLQTLQTTSRGIAWRADGPVDAPALLLLGSLGTTSDIWRPQIQPLSERYRVVRLDTRGHGRSEATAGTVALDDLGADAVSVLDAAGVERVAVCGVSLGGMTAMWLAAHVPDRVRSLRRRQHRIEDRRSMRCGKSASVRFAPAAPNRSPTRRWDAGSPNGSAVRIPTSYRGAGRC